MTVINERELIALLVSGMPRSPQQLNRPHESDAELIRLPGLPGALAITTDGVVEEIASGLYADPFLAGWMTVVVNASDLAAVGAEPVGMLISECLPPEMDRHMLAELQRGIRAAAEQHGIPLLGGDTNTSPTLHLTATAIGVVRREPPLTRIGARVGDRLFASAPLGVGSAFAFHALLGPSGAMRGAAKYQPCARVPEGRIVAEFASSCMDTSDGAIATVDELMHLNHIGMLCTVELDACLHPAARETARTAGIPPWAMLAGPHGEFELLFTIPADRCAAFRAKAAQIGWYPLPLGYVVDEVGLRWRNGAEVLSFDTKAIRTLFAQVHGDAKRYVTELLGRHAPVRITSRAA